MSLIRLTKTPELTGALNFLRSRYKALSEIEIIKMAVSEVYYKEQQEKPAKSLTTNLKDLGKNPHALKLNDEEYKIWWNKNRPKKRKTKVTYGA